MSRNTGTPSTNMEEFRETFKKSKHIVILTGAGVSAESGVPTFRGQGGFWRTCKAEDLATPEGFRRNPSLAWEFYHHCREEMNSKFPNPAHTSIAQCEERLAAEDRRVVVITQNVDELHKKAGSRNIIELHGSLFQTKCTKCGSIKSNYDSPICAALKDKGAPDPKAKDAKIPVKDLPRCNIGTCTGLLRPNVVWFGESLGENDLARAFNELSNCDLCLVVGTSSVVYPAAMFAPQLAKRGIPVAEFNLESTPVTSSFSFHFEGPCGELLPKALAS